MRSIFFVFIVGLMGVAFCYQLANVSKERAVREAIDARDARIKKLTSVPVYNELIERGREICPMQADEVIWACGAVVRMPQNGFPLLASKRRCSSPEEPKYVGGFTLPEVTSAEPDTEGLPVRVSIPITLSGKGRYTEVGSWRLYADDLPTFSPCDVREGRECATVSIFGQRSIVSENWVFNRAVPENLESERPKPEAIAHENHPLMDDVFLNLDGNPVAHAVGYPNSQQRHICRFRTQHPSEGYVVSLSVNCDYVEDWREILRGILAELSNRTLGVDRSALCDMPPLNSRITPKARRTSLDQHQAMHDWALERTVQ